MYSKFLEPKNWRKISAEVRRRNCAVLPYILNSFCRQVNRSPGLCRDTAEVLTLSNSAHRFPVAFRQKTWYKRRNHNRRNCG